MLFTSLNFITVTIHGIRIIGILKNLINRLPSLITDANIRLLSLSCFFTSVQLYHNTLHGIRIIDILMTAINRLLDIKAGVNTQMLGLSCFSPPFSSITIRSQYYNNNMHITKCNRPSTRHKGYKKPNKQPNVLSTSKNTFMPQIL